MDDLERSFDHPIAENAMETDGWDAPVSRELSRPCDRWSPVTEIRISLSPTNRPNLALGMSPIEFADVTSIYRQLQKARSCGFRSVRTLILPAELQISWNACSFSCNGHVGTLAGFETASEAALRLLVGGLVRICETIKAGDSTQLEKLSSSVPASKALLEIVRICASRKLPMLLVREDGGQEEVLMPDVRNIPPPGKESPLEPKPITAVFTGFSGNDLFFNRGLIRARVSPADMATLQELQAGDLVEVFQRGKRYRCMKTLDNVNASEIRVIRSLLRPSRQEEGLQLSTSQVMQPTSG